MKLNQIIFILMDLLFNSMWESFTFISIQINHWIKFLNSIWCHQIDLLPRFAQVWSIILIFTRTTFCVLSNPNLAEEYSCDTFEDSALCILEDEATADDDIALCDVIWLDDAICDAAIWFDDAICVEDIWLVDDDIWAICSWVMELTEALCIDEDICKIKPNYMIASLRHCLFMITTYLCIISYLYVTLSIL